LKAPGWRRETNTATRNRAPSRSRDVLKASGRIETPAAAIEIHQGYYLGGRQHEYYREEIAANVDQHHRRDRQGGRGSDHQQRPFRRNLDHFPACSKGWQVFAAVEGRLQPLSEEERQPPDESHKKKAGEDEEP
jgi:hypothetical protein